jgi:hypothetical protein
MILVEKSGSLLTNSKRGIGRMSKAKDEDGIITHRLNGSLTFMIHKETGSLVVTNDDAMVLGAASTQEFANLFQVMMEWAESSR